MAGVINPYVNAAEVMSRQTNDPVDLLSMTDITGKSQRALGMPNAIAGALCPPRIARKQDNTCASIRKCFSNGLTDAHRSARDHDDFPRDFHVRLLFRSRTESQGRAYNRRKLRRQVRLRYGVLLSPLLPLFPLDLVLLPGTPLPLHIFEPRYKEMIGECLENKTLFGVVRAQETDLADIGCTAEIIAVTKTYDDGRMDIVTQGRERFELLEINQDRSFLRGEVLVVTDDPDKAPPAEVERALDLHKQILALANAEQDLPPDDETPLSYHLAGSLPLDLDFKQKLLATRSEPQRIQTVIGYFETILPNLRRAIQIRKKAGGNGQAH